MVANPSDRGVDNASFSMRAKSGAFLLRVLGFGGRRLLLALLALASLVLTAYFIFYEEGFSKTGALRQEKERLEDEIGRLEEANRQLLERIERIKIDAGYAEDEARRKLGLVKPDEIIYRLADEPDWQPDDPDQNE